MGSKFILICQNYLPGALSHFYIYTGTSKSTVVKIHVPLEAAYLTSSTKLLKQHSRHILMSFVMVLVLFCGLGFFVCFFLF